MHVLFRESHGLDETAQPEDLGQSPADLVVLSFSDSDLGAFAAGWRRGRDQLPTLRLANLSRLRHPLSVDTYAERTLSAAKGILVRLIGGRSYWPYGVDELSRLAREKGIALAFLPAFALFLLAAASGMLKRRLVVLAVFSLCAAIAAYSAVNLLASAYGNTWTAGEILRGLFLAQLPQLGLASGPCLALTALLERLNHPRP